MKRKNKEKEKKIKLNRGIFTILKLPEKELSSLEKKRKMNFLIGKKKLEELEWNECKVCGKEIPAPLDFCSSKCREQKRKE